MRRSWKVLTFSSVSTAANEVRGEKRRRGTRGTGRTKLGSVLQGSGLNTGLVHTRQTLSHLDICGGLVPDISLTWYGSPQMLNPYCQLAQRLLQPRHAVCPVYFKSLKITILNYQCQANARHGSFSQIFPICSWLSLRLQNPKARKVNWLYVFFGGCQPKRKLCPWESWRNSSSSELPRNSVGNNGHFLLLMYNVVLKWAKTQARDGWMQGQPANIPTLSQSQKNWSTQSGGHSPGHHTLFWLANSPWFRQVTS